MSTRGTKFCRTCLSRPVRKRTGATLCTPCAARAPKRACIRCGTLTAPDLMRGPRCRACSSAVAREKRVQKTYSLNQQDHDAILALQGGGCGICGRVLKVRALCVDHDHSCCSGPTSCGQCVRGLLCSTCNKYLGYIGDRAEVGSALQSYLTQPPAMQVERNVP